MDRIFLSAVWGRLMYLRMMLIILFMALVAVQAEKPQEWNEEVKNAGSKPPVFWINGVPESGREKNVVSCLSGLGYWGEEKGAISTLKNAASGINITDFDQYGPFPSSEGSLAILFRTPSKDFFKDRDGEAGKIVRNFGSIALFTSKKGGFEIAMWQSKLRIAGGSDPQALSDLNSFGAFSKILPRLVGGTWYWLALSWKESNGEADVQWRLIPDGDEKVLEKGTYRHPSLFFEGKTQLTLAGRSFGDTFEDGFIGQFILWDSYIEEVNWLKMEALLKRP